MMAGQRRQIERVSNLCNEGRVFEKSEQELSRTSPAAQRSVLRISANEVGEHPGLVMDELAMAHCPSARVEMHGSTQQTGMECVDQGGQRLIGHSTAESLVPFGSSGP